jgi:hypothetical protein
VYVTLTKPVVGLFSAGTNPTGHATACDNANVGACGFCVLGKDSYSGQNGTLIVNGAPVAIDGTPSFGPHGTINAAAGTTLYDGGAYAGSGITPAPTITSGPLQDPLAELVVPSFAGLAAQSACNAAGHAVAGIYAQIPTCGPLDPGLYVITGGTHISGNTTIDASSGVTLYLTCGSGTVPQPCNSSGQSGAGLTCTGNASFSITAPTSGPTAHLAIFFDRNNTNGIDCRGNGSGAINGTVYGTSASLTMRGNGNGCASADFNALVVIASANFNGSPSSFCANYVGTQNVTESSIQLTQ